MALEVLHKRLRTDLRRALAAGVLAVIVLGIGSNLGDLHSPALHARVIAAAAAAGFAILGVLATHTAASALGRAASHTSPGAAPATRLLCVLTGYLVVSGGTLGLLTVPWQHLLVGGAVTGVVAGIAAQQPLSNLFAGLLLLLARPVSVGQSVRVHSGALGGPLDGAITDISLLYTTMTHGEDILRIPNAALRTTPNLNADPGTSQERVSEVDYP